MSDQQAQAPENVITSVMWDMAPTVDYVLDQVAGGHIHGPGPEGLQLYAKGGAMLAPINAAIAGGVPQDAARQGRQSERTQIQAGRSGSTSTKAHPADVARSPAPSPAS